MSFFQRLLANHVLTNLFFVLVVVLGSLSYVQMPRQQDPSINFNWIQVIVALPGASAEDVEKKVINILEEGIETVSDVKFVSSNSRESIGSILIRFNDISQEKYVARLADLRRKIDQKANLLPQDASDPTIFEITSSNAFPSATIVLSGTSFSEQLRYAGKQFKRKIERLKKVDRAIANGLQDPEIQIQYFPEELANYRLNLDSIAHTVRLALADHSAGDIVSNDQVLLVRTLGIDKNPEAIAQIPINANNLELPLSAIAKVERVRDETDLLVSYKGQPSILFTITKKENSNTLELVKELQQLVIAENKKLNPVGLNLEITDDRTEITVNAINIMQNNFLIGLLFVLLTCFLFLGSRIAIMTTISIPFTVAGVFILLASVGFTLNTSVLLGVVIALGMIVDDAVVIVESIYYKMRQGIDNNSAIIDGIKEVIAPVTTSVLTTTATFMPLMLMPGILGKFMFVIPFVVCVALLISLIEAYWLLPSHITMMNINLSKPSLIQRLRSRFLRGLEYYYAKLLLVFLKRPLRSLCLLLVIAATALYMPANGLIQFNFFASDTIRLFYVNVVMPTGTPVAQTLQKTLEVEQLVRQNLRANEARSIVSYAGNMFTQTEPFVGQQYGQVQVSLHSKEHAEKLGKIAREVAAIVAPIRADIAQVKDVEKLSILTLAGGPPSSRPVSMKFLGDRFEEMEAAVADMRNYLETIPAFLDIADDVVPGATSLNLRLKYANLGEYGLQPQQLINLINSLIDGLYVTTVSVDNENVEVRLISAQANRRNSGNSVIQQLLNTQAVLPSGQLISLSNLVETQTAKSKSLIRHYNFSRSITLESDLDKTQMDTVQANQLVADYWQKISGKHPNVSIDFSGELDDIQESLDSIFILFTFGIGLIYLILGTQFRSYVQPLLILTAIPMAFIGVIFGLLFTGYPLSLFTMYGIVALSGIAVNSSIVMVATANRNENLGMSRAKAMFYAAKRRILPICITTLTTVAGLFSLATGLGGESLIWGPVASAIVFGLIVSSTLTVLFLPCIYAISVTTFISKFTRKRLRSKDRQTI